MGVRFLIAATSIVFAVLGAVATGIALPGVLHIPMGHVWASVNQGYRILSLMGALVILTVVSYLFSIWAVRPIRDRLLVIEEAAVIIGAGRLHHRVDAKGYHDEIGRLAAQFNQMAKRIERQVGMLQRLADENKRLATESERYAVLEERQRLARDLHDSVSQQLFALTMLSSAALRQMDGEQVKLERTLHQLAELSNAAQREMRALLLNLRPVELDGRPLVEAAREFLQATRERHGIDVTFDVKLDSGMLSPAIEDALFRIVQEAVANVIKHSGAANLNVRLMDDNEGVNLVVMDDGVGVSRATETSAGYGLQAMRERAEALGGRCEVLNREKGTAVSVWVPIVANMEVEEE